MRCAVLVVFSALAAAGQDSSLARLQREMERLGKVSGGVVGATAIHVETGRRVSINPADPFPMASTVKVPLAVELLSRVDEGKERLDRMVAFEQKDLHPGSGTLTDLFRRPGLSLSIANLLELMLLISDNSATDVLLREVGGAASVDQRMKTLGIIGLSVDRPTIYLIADAVGWKLPPEAEWRPQVFADASRAVGAEARAAARRAFYEDRRDTSTPDAMATLLARIHRKELHQPATAELLLDIMRRCRTGQARLKGLLPAGTVVAHKTGTIATSANDAGILTLPDGAGHVALAVFVKKADQADQAERAIAEIARAVHDYFLFHPEGVVNYEKMAERIVASLAPERREKVLLRPDPGYFEALLDPLRRRLAEAGALETRSLDEADIYLWLPLRPGGPGLPPAERMALVRWTDQGGKRRQVHFHWGEGSVMTDGLFGQHSEALDALYMQALEIDYRALSEAQSRAIERLKSGEVRVRTLAGTDIRFRTGDRPFNKQDGDASARRASQARMRIDRDIELPAGVLRVAPLEDSVNGVIAVPEGRFSGETARDVKMHFRKGRMVKVEAGENLAAVEKFLKEGGDAARRFREVALGFNPKLKPAPGSRILPYYGYGEGVVRLSLGDNEELGGAVRGGFARWLFFPDAVVEVDGKPLVAGRP
jgi:beta-lactamase class A